MKKILCFRWELVIGLISTILFLMILSTGYDEIYEVIMCVMSFLFIPLSYIGVKVARKLMKEVWL